MNRINIALDGPSGAGKSTLAKEIARRLGIIYVDTGAMYRAIGLFVCRAGVDPKDGEGVCALLPGIDVTLSYEKGSQHVLLNGEDVSGLIRTPQISMAASAVSAIPQVRSFLLELQRGMARMHSVIMDGRDIGTVILPDAQVKIFLYASPEARAKRRLAELHEKGVETDYKTVLSEMKERDEADRSRAVAPAVPAEDAVMLDNSDLTFEGTVDAAMTIINRVRGEH